jgi:hypothetical protein
LIIYLIALMYLKKLSYIIINHLFLAVTEDQNNVNPIYDFKKHVITSPQQMQV